ncbi:MAG TPA: hypothetical protein VFW07_23100 [Parafilimonas sp.]|nr:hypothetical protein [Parafilimonas sp.]
MKKFLTIVIITSVFISCGSNSENAAEKVTTVNSITPPPTSDTASVIAPMMGDTSKADADSVEK